MKYFVSQLENGKWIGGKQCEYPQPPFTYYYMNSISSPEYFSKNISSAYNFNTKEEAVMAVGKFTEKKRYYLD